MAPLGRIAANYGGTAFLSFDYWPVLEIREKQRSPIGAYVGFGNIHPSGGAFVAPGPDGAAPSPQLEAFREGLQITEAILHLRSASKAPAEAHEVIQILMDVMESNRRFRPAGTADVWNYVRRVYELAAKEPRADHPSVELSNGVVDMALYLPDPVNGYYRGTRFDWSGVVSSFRYEGHEFFGEWQHVQEPTVHDRICGPVESFETDGIAWGYKEAAVGEGFVKIGVGVLEKPEERKYRWNGTYKITDPGIWEVKHGGDFIEFKHTLNGPRGMAYVYTKTITLTRNPPGFTIGHVLENTGTAMIDTTQYNHNFFVMDRQPSGPDFTLRFPFELKATHGVKGALDFEGRELTFGATLENQHGSITLEGFGPDVKDHAMVLENRKLGVGVKVSVDRPLHRLRFWSVRTTICPENFIHLRIPPGSKEMWTSTYVVYALTK
jgi:hypothetical protein